MTIIRIQNNLSIDQWRDFVANHPDGNIFHTPEMFQVFSRTKNNEPQLWAAVDGNGQVLALFTPVVVTLGGGLPRRLTTRAVAYGSVLYESTDSGENALGLLLEAYTKDAGRTVLFTELRNLSDLSSAQPILDASNFIYEDHLDYIITLYQPAERILENMGRRTRKHIRRAVRKGEITVEEVQDHSHLDILYETVAKSYMQARVPLADRSLFRAAFDILQPLGMIKFWLARHEQAIVAASVELVYKQTLYGWYGGVDRSYSSYQPGELLMWHILKWGAENGFSRYDFGGAGTPDEEYGVRDFKAKFGGELVCYGRNTCVHSPKLLRLSEFGYRQYRRLLQLKH
jgi:serine/alanine adding enzyme